VIANVRCDFKRAAEDFRFLTFGTGWGSATELTLQAVESASTSASGGTSSPLTPGILAIDASGSLSGTADRTVSFKFTQDLDDTSGIECAPESRNGRPRLQGDLGIYAWLQNLDETLRSSSAEVPESNYTLEFTIVRSGGAGAAFSLVPIGTSVLGAGVGLAGSRKDSHKILITFSKNKEAPAASKGGKRKSGGRKGISSDDEKRLERLNTLGIIGAVQDR
jgi:hypothetical protein